MRIIETTKQYIAVDSIIASPTNNVLVMVGAASGCCAMELNAEATDLPSPKAGIIQPILVVSPAVIIDATAIRVVLSIVYFYLLVTYFTLSFFASCTAAVIYTVASILKI